MKGLTIATCALAVLATSGAAAAQDGDAEAGDEVPVSTALEDEIVVVANRAARESSRVTSAVTRLTREDLERRGSVQVAEILREIPGVQLVDDGPLGGFSRLHVRGAASNHTLVLVDGIPVNDATTGGGHDFNDLTTDAVESIEVLRGSYSVLYGSEAIGGVVNVTTRRGRGPARWFVRGEGGSFATWRTAAGVSGRDEETEFALTLGETRSEGERARQDFEVSELTGRLGFPLGERARLDTTLRWSDSRVESPFDFASTGVLPEDPNIRRERRTVVFGTTLTVDAADWLELRGSASVLDVESEFRNGPDGADLIDPDFTPGSGDEFTVTRDELATRSDEHDVRGRLEARIDVSDAAGWDPAAAGGLDLDLVLGVESLEQESDSVVVFPDFNAPTSTEQRSLHSILTKSRFAQAELRLPDVDPVARPTLVAGIRSDDHETFGREGSPFVGGRLEFAATGTVLRATRGEGFRAPKPSELFDPFVGNEALGPETSESVDVGFEQTMLDGTLAVEGTWFELETEGLIAFDADFTTTTRPFGALRNFRRTRTHGTEWALVWDAGCGFTVRGSYTRQRPRDLDTRLDLPNRVRSFGSAGVTWRRGDWQLSLDGLFSGRSHDQGGEITYPESSERRRPGRRRLVDLTARYRASETVTLFGRIENLLDDDWVATPTAPAGAPLGVFFGALLEF